jgi:dystrophin
LCRVLQAEYDQLWQAHNGYYTSYGNAVSVPADGASELDVESSREAEMIVEAKLLRQHKGRLETRMRILEEHNQQLESQLHRLRQLVESVSYSVLSTYSMVFLLST